MADGRDLVLKATLTLADGTVMELGQEDLTLSGLTVSEAVSASGRFEVGAAVVGSGTITLSNYTGKFDDVDFTGATVVPYVGIEMADGTVEWLRRAFWNVEQPSSYGTTIALECLDNLSLLNKPFADVQVNFPATVQVLADAICRACGVVFAGGEFPNRGYTFNARPERDMDCRDALSYIAQAAGCFAKCDTAGRVLLAWYDTSDTGEASLDGGTYDTATTPYSDGDRADGGGFMTGGDTADGGAFGTARGPVLADTKSLTVMTDDVVITGVRVTAEPEKAADGTQGADGETVLRGSEGYVLAISGNPFIEYGRAAEVARNIGANAIGMRFRPLQCTAVGDPSFEAGDPAIVLGIAGDMHRCYLTRITWKASGFEDYACDAEPAARNTATGYAAQTQDNPLKRALRAEKTAREAAMEQIRREIATSSGLYVTPQVQQDGSTIYYAHDKPELEDSSIVWKMTAEAIGISTDGGQTYPYALDVTGIAILNRVYAIGIDADYLTTGRIEDRNGYNYWDLDSGEFQMASTATVGGKTVSKIAQDAVDAQTQADVFAKLTNDGALQGLYMKDGQLYINGTYMVMGKVTSKNGLVYFDLDNNLLVCSRITASNAWSGTGDDPGDIIAEVSRTKIVGGVYYYSFFDVYNVKYKDGVIRLRPANTSSTSGGGHKYESWIQTDKTNLVLASHQSDSNFSWLRLGDYEASLAAYKGAYGNTLEIDANAQEVTSRADFKVGSGYQKYRIAQTKNYGERLMTAYETASPMFGDIGSGAIGEDGVCVVMVDDVFAETVRCDLAYQVFLQKCGEGDLWVESKRPYAFTVRGTPGLPFDWEVKAHQAGFESRRMEENGLERLLRRDSLADLSAFDDAYAEEVDYAGTIERIQYETAV